MTQSIGSEGRPRGGVVRSQRGIWAGLLLGGALASSCHRKPVTHLPEPVYEKPTLPVFRAQQPAPRPTDDLELEAGEWAGDAPPGSDESPQDIAPSDAASASTPPPAPPPADLEIDASELDEHPTSP